MPHDILSVFSAKAVEYPLALLYLALFVPFWRYVNGGRKARAEAHAAAHAGRRTAPAFRVAGLFSVPGNVYFHPGHSWARIEAGVILAGMDDFAHKLVGPIRAIHTPAPGATVTQGEQAWTLASEDGRTIDMLSPVDGTIVEVNQRALESPTVVAADPYGDGWLLKVRPSRPAGDLKQLLVGSVARRWTEDAWESLLRLNPELGPVSLDGGQPVSGMARAADPKHWDKVAREFFLTGEEGTGYGKQTAGPRF
ncbi:MAG: glycine cleavage system protein H [Vicinamibacterales bacterium]